MAAANVVWLFLLEAAASVCLLTEADALTHAAVPLATVAAAAAALLQGWTNNGKITWPGTRENHLLRAEHRARSGAEEA